MGSKVKVKKYVIPIVADSWHSVPYSVPTFILGRRLTGNTRHSWTQDLAQAVEALPSISKESQNCQRVNGTGLKPSINDGLVYVVNKYPRFLDPQLR